ncbi:hypothetical protein ES319_A05G269900v1 [Gossypium barbadense]|uniref:Uncharacterized protein n=2 Tax=Gossypium TaxID=3633 RepID=A0A5J5VV08_GOSBA|nr:hypothetical protein ES319_A05G269900v1 [Gossypium barbadense]TYH18528.1 hypothetical protein ES288_A05G278800v1 [Gossypium darwinii]
MTVSTCQIRRTRVFRVPIFTTRETYLGNPDKPGKRIQANTPQGKGLDESKFTVHG